MQLLPILCILVIVAIFLGVAISVSLVTGPGHTPTGHPSQEPTHPAGAPTTYTPLAHIPAAYTGPGYTPTSYASQVPMQPAPMHPAYTPPARTPVAYTPPAHTPVAYTPPAHTPLGTAPPVGIALLPLVQVMPQIAQRHSQGATNSTQPILKPQYKLANMLPSTQGMGAVGNVQDRVSTDFTNTWVKRTPDSDGRSMWFNYMTGEQWQTCKKTGEFACDGNHAKHNSFLDHIKRQVVPLGETPPNYVPNEFSTAEPHLNKTGVVSITSLDLSHLGESYVPGTQMLLEIKRFIDPVCAHHNIRILNLVEICCCDAYLASGTKSRFGSKGASGWAVCNFQHKTLLAIGVRLRTPKFAHKQPLYNYKTKTGGVIDEEVHPDLHHKFHSADLIDNPQGEKINNQGDAIIGHILHEIAHEFAKPQAEYTLGSGLEKHGTHFYEAERVLKQTFKDIWGFPYYETVFDTTEGVIPSGTVHINYGTTLGIDTNLNGQTLKYPIA